MPSKVPSFDVHIKPPTPRNKTPETKKPSQRYLATSCPPTDVVNTPLSPQINKIMASSTASATEIVIAIFFTSYFLIIS